MGETLSFDRDARTDINVAVGNEIYVNGQIKSVDFPKTNRLTEIVKSAVKGTGYNDEWCYDIDNIKISFGINKQSSNVDTVVSNGRAGDTITKVGFATNETPEYLPLPHVLARKIAQKLDQTFLDGDVDGLGPDGKLNLAVAYENGKPEYVSSVVVAAQHRDGIDLEKFRGEIMGIIIPEIRHWYDKSLTRVVINGSGLFVYGGPIIDTGVKGKKDADHTYGNLIGHTGGSAYGKDPSKVDLHGLVTARWIAKSLVASGMADAAKVELTYLIGDEMQLEISVNTFGTSDIPESRLVEIIERNFPLKPKEVVDSLGLRDDPELFPLTAGYFFGDKRFPWETVKELR